MRALLLKPNLSYEEVQIKDYRDTRTLVEGNIELIPTTKDIKFGKRLLVAYANESGLMEHLPYNQWGTVLSEMGFYVNSMYGIAGNVVLLLTDDNGYDKSITDEVVILFLNAKNRVELAD